MFSLSFGSSSTVCVCEPRQFCTFVTSFGFLTSVMSKMRMPRTRSFCGPGSVKPPNLQSARLFVASDDMNSRLPYTETSFCDAGHSYAPASTGFAGFEMSQISKPL